MQAKIINKTTITKREIIVSQLLNNRFLMIIYAITLLLFIIIRIFSVINGINISTTQTVLSVLIIIVCLGVILYPFFNAIRWERRYKKLYGVTTQNIEYHFFDIYVKVIAEVFSEALDICSQMLEYVHVISSAEAVVAAPYNHCESANFGGLGDDRG